MSKSYILVIDSGIGGISLLNELIKRLPDERYLYLGDNENVPYGNKTNDELLSLVISNLLYAIDYDIKTIVLGCNTLSLSVRDKLEYVTGKAVFGVFPPLESELIKGNKTLLLATPKTCENYKSDEKLTCRPQVGLATDVETNAFSLNKVNLTTHLGDIDERGSFDNVVLGCTHYNFIKNEIFNHFCPKKITSGNHLTVEKVAKYLKGIKSLEKSSAFELKFLGKNSKINEKFYFEVVKRGFFE